MLFDERREDVLALEVEVDVVERRRALEELALGDVDEHTRRDRRRRTVAIWHSVEHAGPAKLLIGGYAPFIRRKPRLYT